VLALCGLLTALLPARVSAEWQFAPFVGFNFLGDTNLLFLEGATEQHWNLGGTVRLVGAGPLGVETFILYVPGFFNTPEGNPIFADTPPEETISESRTFALMGNLVLTTPRSWNQYGLRPFVSGGFGLLNVHATDEAGLFPTRANLPGYNVGGGAVGFLTDRVGLRFDLRYFRTLPPGQEPTAESLTLDGQRVRLHYWTGTLGVVIKY
jgi:hypothetical protein